MQRGKEMVLQEGVQRVKECLRRARMCRWSECVCVCAEWGGVCRVRVCVQSGEVCVE